MFITSGIGGVALTNSLAWWGGVSAGFIGNAVGFIIGGVILSVVRLFYPLALHAGQFEHGTYAVVQLPLVLGACFTAVIVLAVARRRLEAIALGGLLTYMAAMLLTNDLSFFGRVDHSKDLPIGKQLNGLDRLNKPTADDVRKVAGPPLAEAVFLSSSDLLPKEVRENIASWKRSDAKIFAYYEEDKWNRRFTYYVLFDPISNEQFSMVGLSRRVAPEYWPNRAVDSTVTGVTSPASSIRSGQALRQEQP